MKSSSTDKITVELTELEAEKVNACIMLIAKKYAVECEESGIDINGSGEEAQRYRFYRELAKKFK